MPDRSPSIRGLFLGGLPRRPGPVYPWLERGVFLGSMVPAVSLAWRGSQNTLGANPIATAENELGLTAFIFLIAALACTPAKEALGWAWAVKLRRQFGLFAFGYAILHFLAYLVLDQFFDVSVILADIAKRPFITVGFVALLMLLPLAITSTNGRQIRPAGRWLHLHRLIYLAAVLVAIHFVWRVKLDVTQPLIYAALVGVLLVARVFLAAGKRP